MNFPLSVISLKLSVHIKNDCFRSKSGTPKKCKENLTRSQLNPFLSLASNVELKGIGLFSIYHDHILIIP